jgi:flagellar basal body-associated protein FliL
MAEEQNSVSQEKAPVDIDALLDELDPSFKEQLGIITSAIAQIGPISGLESISLSAEYFNDGAKVEDIELNNKTTGNEDLKSEEVALQHSIGQIIFELTKQTLTVPMVVAVPLFKLCWRMKKEGLSVLKSTGEILSPPFQTWLVPFLAFIKRVKAFKRQTYFRLIVIVFLLIVLRFLLVDMKKHLTPDGERDPFLKSWSEVASQSYEIPPEDDNEDLLNPLRHPEYTVRLHRIVSNLKSKDPRVAPMLAAELYVEASNQDCAIEIHERDLEVRDAIERVFEETTYEDIDSSAGKERLKIRIRSALDHFLTKGHVKRVFFSAINIAP